MSDDQLIVLILCALGALVCFLWLGLHVDLIEWWSKKRKR